MPGLWGGETVGPESSGPSGSSELAFGVAHAAAAEATHAQWQGRDLTIVEAPTTMSFGQTFVARDSDGHRVVAFAPAA